MDTNILIDWISHRESFYDQSRAAVLKCSDIDTDACIAAHSITNIFYILRHKSEQIRRKEIFDVLEKIFHIIPLDTDKLRNAVSNTSFTDIEDCLQAECAKEFGADYIVTRNVKDFTGSSIPAVTPGEFIRLTEGIQQ
ncbi:MAG: PIN domain-containing protein [Oscillospiraceae bacterium]|nr:PIN domain-containing protein [Oscillospiraceae bacterium]